MPQDSNKSEVLGLDKHQDCLFMFSSHQIELRNHLNRMNGQVDCRYFEASESAERLHFDYRLRPGISEQRLGMRVLREEGIFELLDEHDYDTKSTNASLRFSN